MGVYYHLIDDDRRESFELNKGQWHIVFADVLECGIESLSLSDILDRMTNALGYKSATTTMMAQKIHAWARARESVGLVGDDRDDRGTEYLETGSMFSDWYQPENIERRLNLGCGDVKRANFTNIDRRENVGADRVVDLLAFPWPWCDRQIETITAFHVLPYFGKLEGEFFVRECHRILELGGRLVLEMSNLTEAALELADGNLQMLQAFYGEQKNWYESRRYGYTAESLTGVLRWVGFEVGYSGPGTDHHAKVEPCMRLEATKR